MGGHSLHKNCSNLLSFIAHSFAILSMIAPATDCPIEPEVATEGAEGAITPIGENIYACRGIFN